jgi:hypothetical protein
MQSLGRRVEAAPEARELETLVSTVALVAPRVRSVPECVDTVGPEMVEWAREHGLTLDPEQELVLEESGGLNESGRWAAPEVGFNAPRQNGKGEVLLARELYGLFEMGERFIVHSAHEFKTSARHFQRCESVIRQNDDLLERVRRHPDGNRRVVGFKYSHGDEQIELDDGSLLQFRTRTKSSLRGFDDVGLLVLDEAMIFSEWAHGTMLPTVRASSAPRGPQLWYAGSAADQEVHDHAVVWARIRERGLEGDDALAYFEWSIDFDHPFDVPDEVAADHGEWRKVNWAIERGRVPIDHMERLEYRSMPRRAFCVELLGVGDWPDTDLMGSSVFDMERWALVCDPQSRIDGAVCIAFDISPDRRATIVVCGLGVNGKMHVEVITSGAGTGWVPPRLADLCEKHDVVELVCDGFGPANTVASRVEERTGLSVRRLKSGDYADACGQFANAVEEGDMVHIGQEELTVSVKGACTRPLVDRFAWSRSKSRTDPGPVIAASLALWSAVDRDIGNRDDLEIF